MEDIEKQREFWEREQAKEALFERIEPMLEAAGRCGFDRDHLSIEYRLDDNEIVITLEY